MRFEEWSRVWTVEKLKEFSKQGPRARKQFVQRHASARKMDACESEPDNARADPPGFRARRLSRLPLRQRLVSPNHAGNATEASEIVRLEVLASDLAVTIENSRLHHQLVRSEKLAALGQLVAGVAHELNNPLTGIMGYADLLGEEVQGEKLTKRVQKLGSEARRMKRIVDGLLRFARQNNPAARAADFEAALHDVIQLREFHIRKLGIHMDVRIDPLLPRLAIGEDELKQVLLNHSE